CHSQKPAISSFVSANGPSITVRFVPAKRIRLAFELGWSPPPASITPALTSSSLNLPISARSRSLGITPASESLFALISTMNRIVILLLTWGAGPGPPAGRDRQRPASTDASNERRRDRQGRQDFFRNGRPWGVRRA